MKKIILSILFMIFVHFGFTQTVIINEDFELSSLPDGWTRSQASPSVGWEFGDNLGSENFLIPSHTKYAVSNDDAHDDFTTTLNNASEDRLITPVMDLTTFSGRIVALEYAYVLEDLSGTIGTIEVSTDGGNTWVEVFIATHSLVWNIATVNLTSFTSYSNVKVAFRYNDIGGWAYGFAVDDVSIKAYSSGVKKSVLEVHTADWSSYCPDSHVIMTDIDANQPNTICVEIHNNDAMAISDGDYISAAYISGFPNGTIDRFSFDGSIASSRSSWADKCNIRNNMIVPLSVSIESQTYDNLSRELSVTVRTDFIGTMNGDLRFNLFIIEDNVIGSGDGYNQSNYYDNIVGHPFYGAGDPIIGYTHKKVVREMLGGSWGSASIIPSAAINGDSYTHTYTYTLPDGFDETQIYLVGLVQEYDELDINNRQIINAEEVRLSLESNIGIEEFTELSAKVYPNPFSEKTQLEFKLESHSNVKIDVYNLNGAKISTLSNGYMNPGFHSVSWRGVDQQGNFVVNGKYLILFNIDGVKTSFPVILLR